MPDLCDGNTSFDVDEMATDIEIAIVASNKHRDDLLLEGTSSLAVTA